MISVRDVTRHLQNKSSRTEIFYSTWTKRSAVGCWPVMSKPARVSGGSAGSSQGADVKAPRSDRRNVHNDFAVDDRLDIEQEAFQVRGLRIKQITEVLRPRVV